MGQHIRLEPIKEPKIFAEVKTIGKGLYKSYKTILDFVLGKDFEKFDFKGKKLMRLPNNYNLHEEDDSVFNIGNFTLQEDWKEDRWLTENTSLECHFDKNGNVNAIYIVL